MKISTLRCELNTKELASMKVLARIGHMKYLWQVFIDDVLISRRAMPFGPGDEWIELEADEEYPVAHDGDRTVWARKGDGMIVWFGALPGYPFVRSPGLDENEVFVFEAAQYREAILACISQDSPDLARTIRHSDAPLKQLDEYELSQILVRSLPGEYDPIFSMPELPADSSGRNLILRARHQLIDLPWRSHNADAPLQNVQLCMPPEKVVEVRIGLDLILGFAESIWLFGTTDRGIAVCFMSRPYFPVWLCGDPIDEAFGNLVGDLLAGPH